jgi:uncharacterized repeat protein (TIGR01451 family)
VIRKFLPACNRVTAIIQSACILFLFLILSGLVNHLSAAGIQAPVRGPKIWLGDNQALPVKPVGAPTLAQSVAAGQAQPTAMATADVDGDGVADMVAGFSAPGGGAIVIHRGNVDAFAPQSNASFQAIGRGQFPAPFLPNAQVFNIPVRPDFIALGRFTPSGHQDLVVAALGGNSLFVFSGDGKGGFGAPQTVPLSGSVTAMASENLLRSLAYSNLVVGIASPQTSSLLVFSGTDSGLSPPAAFPLAAAASNIVFGDFGDSHTDTAFLSGGNVFILHSSNFQMEALGLPVNASAMALGSFIFDRTGGLQIALLTSEGTLHIAARTEFDPRPVSLDEVHASWQATGRRGFGNPLDPPRTLPQNGYKIVESIASAAPFSAGQPPVLFRTRISDHVADDVMVLNPSMGQLAVIAHPDVAPGATTFLPAIVSTRPYSGSPVAALPMRTNIDGRPGVVALHAGQLAPAVMMPLPDPTFFVNRNDDPAPGAVAATCNNVSNADVSSSCSLREAVRKANATPGTDTITLAAGTYTLSIPRNGADHSSALTGALYIQDSVNIVGAGQATTIIQGGSTATNGVDMVFAVNEDIDSITSATASFSNLTIKFGRNRGSVAGTDGDGGGMEFDTGTGGTSNLTLTNVTFDSNAALDGNGGGLAAFNASSGLAAGGPGLVTVNNCIFTNNSVKEVIAGAFGSGGGIMVFDLMHILINSGTSITNNTSTGSGAGMMIFSAGSGSRQSNIHGVTITGNVAQIDGGGLWTAANTVVDQSSLIDNNQATGVNGLGSGGGIRVGVASPDTVTLSKITVTNNKAKVSGAGIATGSGTGGGGATIAFSRMAGNTFLTSGLGTNLNNDHTTVTAINNWWGTNTPAGTINNSTATTTFDPFIQLTHVASPSTIKINQSTTLTGDMSKDNHGSGAALAGNLGEIVGLPITFNNAILGSIPNAQPETLDAGAQATATFNAGGTSGTGHADATVDQQAVTANIVILEPLRIVKSFSPNPVAVNASSTLTFAVNNPNVIAVDANFTDTLPAGLVVAATPGVTNTCGGTVTAVAGSGSVSFSNASLPIGACSISVKVSSGTDSVYNNSVTINSTAAGTGALSTSSASLTVINPPSITKAFGAASIPLNGTTSLTFTLNSTNVNLTLNGVAFTDSLPAGLVVATPGNLNSTCSGTATAVDGSSSISLSGASLAPGASCTVSVNVTGTTAGVKNNSVQATSTNGGTGNTSNASLTVVAPPTISKAFNPTSIALNANSTLSFTIVNPNTASALSGVGFNDNLPAGVVVAATPNITGSCGSGTITATAGSGSISLSGGTLTASPAAGSSCTFSVDVTGTTAGSKSNTTGAVTSTEGGTGATSNTAPLTVVAPPSIAKAFGAAAIPLNGTTTLTFTITNPAANTVAETGVAFTDTLPVGLVVATPNGLTNTCGGTPTAVAGTGSISLTGGTIAASSNCILTVNITGTTSGNFINTSGSVSSTNGGTGNTATANLTVAAAPTITKSFGVASIPLNTSTSLSFTITNPNTNVALSGVAFTDNLPAGLVVATPNGLTGTCGSGTITAVAGSGTVSLSGGTLTASPAAGSSCTFSVNVTGTTAGGKNNAVQVTSTEGGTGNTSNASITVVAPPTISKAFNPTSIALNASSTLSFTIANPNTASALSGVGFNDNLPAGVVVAATPNVTGSCGTGTITATAGSGSISLTGGTLTASPAAGSSCTFSVDVTATTPGTKNNTSGNVTSTEGGTGGTASASLIVTAAPPTITKSFGAASIPLNASTSLTFTINNSNTVALTGLAFTDSLPLGLVVATPNALTNTCGGTATAVAGSSSISLTAGTVAASGSCTVSVNVTGTTAGVKNNSVQVTSTEGGTGNTSNASITVVAPPVIIKAFGAASIPLNGSTSLSFTIQNTNTTTTMTGVGFSDTLPAGLVISTPNGLTGSCGGGTITATAGTNTISLTGASLAASASCTFSVNVTGIAAGTQNNTTGPVTSTEGGTGGTASASINVVAPPSIAKVFNPANIALNATTSLTFTITNPAANAVALTGVAFTDTLPTGLTVANASATVCGGTLTTTAPTGIALTGATIAVNSQCQFSVTVTGAASGSYTNTTGNVTSTNGGTGNTASANLTVATPPTITKAFGAASIPLNGTTSLTFNITNPNTTTALTGIAFTDSLPAGLVIAPTPALSNTCGGTATAVAGSGSISLAGATQPANGSCTVSVNIQGTTSGVKNNSVTVSATESGVGNTSNASITVTAPPVLIKAFGAASIPLNGGTTLTFTVQNPNTSTSLSGIGFGDTLPVGLKIATPNGLTSTCTGTVTTGTVSGFSVVNLSGATLGASASCTFSVNVVGIAPGTQNNTTGLITSTEGGTGGTASASIDVVAPPSIAKAFNPTTIAVNGVSTLTFTITNPAANAVAETGVAFSDTLPAGIVVATPNNLNSTCGGTPTAVAGSGTVSLSGGSIATGSSCTLSVDVTGAAAGVYNNTSGAVSSTNGGTGNTASASLTIAVADLTITKTHTGTFTRGQNGANWVITVKNSGAGPTLGAVTVVDTLPAVTNPPVATAISGTGWTCTLATLTCSRSDALAPGASYPPITLTVNIPINIQNNFTNTAKVSGGGETNTGNDTATDTVSLGPPIVITPHATTASVVAGGTATFMFDVQDQDPTLGLVTFGCGGLPVGTACSFSPATTNQALTTVTMTVTTSSGKTIAATARNAGPGSRAPMYAALFFPVFGMVGIAFSGRRGRKARMRLALVVIGALALLSFAGCASGLRGIATPAGNYQLSVSAAAGTVQVSTPVTLSVQ